jgi:hypothetical protein
MVLPAAAPGSPLLSDSPGDLDAMFDLAPVSLWVEDFSAVRRIFERWRAEGVEDLIAHLRADPARVGECMAC